MKHPFLSGPMNSCCPPLQSSLWPPKLPNLKGKISPVRHRNRQLPGFKITRIRNFYMRKVQQTFTRVGAFVVYWSPDFSDFSGSWSHIGPMSFQSFLPLVGYVTSLSLSWKTWEYMMLVQNQKKCLNTTWIFFGELELDGFKGIILVYMFTVLHWRVF